MHRLISMGAMLCDVVVVVVRTRPRANAADEDDHEKMNVRALYIGMGLRLAAFGRRSAAISIGNSQDLLVQFVINRHE